MKKEMIVCLLVLTLVFIAPIGVFASKTVNKAELFSWGIPPAPYTQDLILTPGWTQGGDEFWIYNNAAIPSTDTATIQFVPAESGQYDIFMHSYCRNDATTDSQYVIHFKPGGAYFQNANELRVNAYDNSNAAAGEVKVSVNLWSNAGWDVDAICLGRYEMDALTTYTFQTTLVGNTSSGFVWTPNVGITGPQVANTDLIYEEIDAAIVDWNLYIANWEPTGGGYYWGFRNMGDCNFAQMWFLPASDRTVSARYSFEFDEVFGSTGDDQFPDLPIVIYFEPGGAYGVPSITPGVISGVDTSMAANGIVVIDVNTQTAGHRWLGGYYLDSTKDYAVEVLRLETAGTGFLRRIQLQLVEIQTEVEDWMLY